ncbi:RRP12-like protein [Rhynchospora pubera]|uniref:RRP12-like protein n=1 Tax=Rhynchospora pubera TaxID=906938 RepID=A0AAV8HF46_9POAL|nr:RRP12-like protein [Rhynchospora pubera]
MDFEMDISGDLSDNSDLGAAVLRRFEASDKEENQRLCAVVGGISQSLKDLSMPLIPSSYFMGAATSLEPLSMDPASASDSKTVPLLVFLSYCVPMVPIPVVRSRGAKVCETVVRILGFESLHEKAVKAGLRCIAGLIVSGDKSSWSNLSSSYGAVLRLATHHRETVRMQSHTCLRDILQSFQNLNILVPASEAITSAFERFLLLAGGSTPQDQTEGEPRGAMQVLYMLGALKECLPLMAPKPSNVILKYLKTLLDLHQPVVTKAVVEILQVICVRDTNGVNPAILLDILCAIGLSVPVEEKRGDQLAAVARLLYLGTKKVYNLNKEMTVMKLPLIFNSLGDILASEHEEALHAAFEGSTALIESCIDDDLINQGVMQTKSRKQGVKSGPTSIEKICSTFEGLLGIQYSAVWDLSFQILSVAFDTLGESSCYLMAEVIRSLVEMQTLPDEDFSFQKQLHETIGSAVAAVGPKEFFNILQFKDINDDNAWILPVLKQHIVGASLNFFQIDVLDMINKIQATISKLVNEGKLFSAKRAEGYVYSLWSLLPSCCNYPCDTGSSFMDLQNVLCEKLCNETNLRGIICRSLQTLIQQNRRIASELQQEDDITDTEDEHLSKSERRARQLYSKEVAEENLKVIKASSSKFFKVFHTLFLESSNEGSGCMQPVICDLASISDKKVVRKVFIDSMKELLSLTKEVVNAKQNDSESMQIDDQSDARNLRRGLLLDFAASLLPGLDAKEIDLLFSAVKPIMQDSDEKIQKKAYKTLSVILKDSDDFLKRNLDTLPDLMLDSSNCHFQSKRYRLECLYYIVAHVLKDSFEQRKGKVISSFLAEILLALKEANTKTRNRAYDLLVEIGHACEVANDSARKENFSLLYNMVASGVTSEIPHMTSAAIKGLARLTYEFSDLIDVAYNMLPSAFLLLQRKNREIIKAILGFIKVLVAKSNANGLNERLSGLVEGLLKWQDNSTNHFKAKVKLLIEMLVRKCGLEAVKKVMPEEHMKLLTNIRKINERKERKAKSLDGSESLTSKTTVSRNSRWNHTHFFSDYGDDGEENDNETEFRKSRVNPISRSRAASLRSTQRRKTTKILSEDMADEQDDDPLDLLDSQTARFALQTSLGSKRKKEPSYDEPEIDSEGRLVVRIEGKRPKKEKQSDRSSDDNNSDSKSFASKKSLVSSASTKANKRRKGSESGWAYTGKEYTSKKAGGDFKKSDKLDPYAYWPLDRKLLNRRAERKAAARKGMASVMKKMTKRLEGKSASSALSARGVKIGKKKQKTGSKSR